MKRKKSLLLPLILLCLPASAYAQTNPIDAIRRIDWSSPGIPGGIPTRTTICATLNPGATAAQINNSIAACPANQIVFLNAGTYTLSTAIDFAGKSNVTLRGAGPDRTIIAFSGATATGCNGTWADVCVAGSSQVWSGNIIPLGGSISNWTAGFAKGATQITLDSTAGLVVGQILILDQLDDIVETGGVLVTHTMVIEGIAGPRAGRAQQQFVKVTAINGNQVTISPGLYMLNWRGSQLPQAWTWGGPSVTAAMNGIENLTLDHTNATNQGGIGFATAYACWVKNVKSLNSGRNHVWIDQAARIEVRDSYFYGTKNAASQSYGVESFGTSDSLIINNIFQHVTSPIMMAHSEGVVVAYNFMIDMFYFIAAWMQPSIVGGHQIGNAMNLFEGNQGTSFLMDLYHGPGALPTLFRNQFTAAEPGKTENTSVINMWGYNRLANVVGNVLGTSGYHTVYEDSSVGTPGAPDRSIYLLGYTGIAESTSSCCPYDALVVRTLFRWGNYD